MVKLCEIVVIENTSKKIVATFSSNTDMESINEHVNKLNEGIEKNWGKGHSYRLDKRPDDQGGNQLHIFGRHGQEWAYRYTGDKSEPSKYKLPPTNIVKDIVADVFNINKNDIEEMVITDANAERILVEIRLVELKVQPGSAD